MQTQRNARACIDLRMDCGLDYEKRDLSRSSRFLARHGVLKVLSIEMPRKGLLELQYLVVDLNGTLTARGRTVPGLRHRLQQLAREVEVIVVTADTRGSAAVIADDLGVRVEILSQDTPESEAKLSLINSLGPDRSVAIGNGHNDRLMLKAAVLGFAVLQKEGAATSALLQADAVFASICDALDALIDPSVCIATLRD